MTPTPEGGSASEAQARLLSTASRIFYAEGIHSVGIDRITAEAKVTRATLYRHFAGKEDLVLAYLAGADRGIRGQVTAARASGQSAVGKVQAVAESITQGILAPGFRGCAFLNAAAEYPDPTHPIHQFILTHRQWFLDTVTDLLAQTSDAPAAPDARHLVMLRDGAMAAGCLFNPELVSATFLQGVSGILLARTSSATASDPPPSVSNITDQAP
ncbi:TetR family transcriptional regulator [Streptomyces sp. NPDC047009]|uniref:TetR/AcrR family transcriptional regulator n=1 Tax=Streptomyces sp. NPDC047009 TaxID=3154496 RepID=UPI0033F27FDE